MRNGLVGATIAWVLIALFACGSDSPTAPAESPIIVSDSVFVTDTIFVVDTLTVTDTVTVPSSSYQFSDSAPLTRNDLTNYIGGSVTGVGEGDIVTLSDGMQLELVVRGYWHEVAPGRMHLAGEVIGGASFDASLYSGSFATVYVYSNPDEHAGYFRFSIQLVTNDGSDVLVAGAGYD